MKYAPVLVLALAGCPADDDSSSNAATLWLAPDGVETRIKLVGDRPPAF
jgi:hypothetical protein